MPEGFWLSEGWFSRQADENTVTAACHHVIDGGQPDPARERSGRPGWPSADIALGRTC